MSGLAQYGSYLYVLCSETDASGTVAPSLLSACIDLIATNATWNSLTGVSHETALNDLFATGPEATHISGGVEVHKIIIQDDGAPGEDRVIHTRASFLDDLTAYGNGVIATDFISGTILSISRTPAKSPMRHSRSLPDLLPFTWLKPRSSNRVASSSPNRA